MHIERKTQDFHFFTLKIYFLWNIHTFSEISHVQYHEGLLATQAIQQMNWHNKASCFIQIKRGIPEILMIVAGNLGHIPAYLYPQLCASCSPPHYCGFLTVNRALHLPPQLKKTNTRPSCNSSCLSPWSLNITRFDRSPAHSWSCTRLLITVSYRTVGIHRTLTSVWNVIRLTAAAANAQWGQACVRLELRLCSGAE